MGMKLIERWSPERALKNALKDVKKSGVDGLKKHLTSKAVRNIQNIESVTSLTSVFTGSDATTVLMEKLSECDWTIIEVMKGSESSRAIVGFAYEDSMSGTIELTMIKEDKIWKIDSLAMPKFDKFTLPQENSAATA